MSSFVLSFSLGLLPPQVPGQSSGRATICRLLQIICEEIPRTAHFISGEALVQETNFYSINFNLFVDLQLFERLLIKSELRFELFSYDLSLRHGVICIN